MSGAASVFLEWSWCGVIRDRGEPGLGGCLKERYQRPSLPKSNRTGPHTAIGFHRQSALLRPPH
jgi:hypothetical protein